MPSCYLKSSDYDAFGCTAASPALVRAASVLIDAYLQKSEGLIYVPGNDGIPAFMDGMTASSTLVSAGAIAPGLNVQVTVTGPVSQSYLGIPLVLDAATASALEVCTVVAIAGQVITLKEVRYAHSGGVKLEAGRVITESRYVADRRPIVTLAKTPIQKVHSAQGRYGFGRRDSQSVFSVSDFNLLSTLSAFGGPPAWESFTVDANNLDAGTGSLWVPAGVLLAYYTEVRVHYVAGYQYEDLPDDIKLACANLVRAAASMPEFQGGNISMLAAGDHKIQRFASTLMNDDVKNMLSNFRARIFV